MKFLTVLLVFVSLNAFAFEPAYDVRVTSDSAITLAIANDTQATIKCAYRMTWFENVLTFKRSTGTTTIDAGLEVRVVVKKDISTNVSLLKAKVECE